MAPNVDNPMGFEHIHVWYRFVEAQTEIRKGEYYKPI